MSIAPSLDLADVIADAIQDASRAEGRSMPGTVVSYDRATQRATVRPCVTRRIKSAEDDEVDEFERHPEVLYGLPVVWPGGGSSFFHPELEAGDPVLIVVADCDFSVWSRTGALGDPVDAREKDYAHSFAIPGPRPRSSSLPAGRTIVAAGGEALSMAIAEKLSDFLNAWIGAASTAGAGDVTGGDALATLLATLTTTMDNPLFSFASTRVKQDAELPLP